MVANEPIEVFTRDYDLILEHGRIGYSAQVFRHNGYVKNSLEVTTLLSPPLAAALFTRLGFGLESKLEYCMDIDYQENDGVEPTLFNEPYLVADEVVRIALEYEAEVMTLDRFVRDEIYKIYDLDNCSYFKIIGNDNMEGFLGIYSRCIETDDEEEIVSRVQTLHVISHSIPDNFIEAMIESSDLPDKKKLHALKEIRNFYSSFD